MDAVEDESNEIVFVGEELELSEELIELIHPSLIHGYLARPGNPLALAFDQVNPARVFAVDEAYEEDEDFADPGVVETTYFDDPDSMRNPVKPQLYT